MHICPDEIGPAVTALQFLPHIAAVLWYKLTSWVRR